MFIENKFYHEYYNIISQAKKQERIKSKEVYYEKHHIVPRSLGGSNDPDNLVLLTAKEHYRVHELLPYFTDGKDKIKMIYAWNLMSRISNKIIDKELYAFLKIQHSKILSEKILSIETRSKMSHNNSGKNNPMYGREHSKESILKMKNRVFSKETKDKISKARSKPFKKITCPNCNKEGAGPNMTRYHFDNCKSIK